MVMFTSRYGLYAGLSGTLHGLFAWGIVRDMLGGIRFSGLLFFGLLAKLVYEVIYGGAASTTEMIGASVAVEAHVAGAVVGLLFAVPHVVEYLRTKPV
ncbi:rhomboid family protein [Veronia nyctiphanis]|uniref:hypothetical protein n=1 Tax=Veronia nyctiphanis TaxID=1278244 RepID=UPI001F475882|nr:hypothetical protein [Veronia nyctiphanis]